MLWRLHESLQLELYERRARAGTIFAVAAGVLVSLVAVALTGSFQSVVASTPAIAPAYIALLTYAAASATTSFLGLNPAHPWERQFSIEGIVWALSRVTGGAVPRALVGRFRTSYDGPLGYRHYAGQALSDAPVLASVQDAGNIGPNDLALQVCATGGATHLFWERNNGNILGQKRVDLGTVSAGSHKIDVTYYTPSGGGQSKFIMSMDDATKDIEMDDGWRDWSLSGADFELLTESWNQGDQNGGQSGDSLFMQKAKRGLNQNPIASLSFTPPCMDGGADYGCQSLTNLVANDGVATWTNDR